jgi:hypothetical protein
MNAMLDARVVAASTQCPASFEQGAVAGRERIMLSSHGSWTTGNIRRFPTRFFRLEQSGVPAAACDSGTDLIALFVENMPANGTVISG